MEITKYKDQYVIRFYYTLKNGKKVHPSITNKEWKVSKYKEAVFKKTIALKAILDKQKQLDEEFEQRDKESHQIGYLVSKYLEFDSLSNKNSTSASKQRSLNKHFVNYFGEDSKPSDVFTTKAISDYRLELSKKGLSSMTLNHIETNIKQFIDYLIMQEELDASAGYRCKSALLPFKKADNAVKEDIVDGNYWTKDEFDTFMDTFEDDDPYKFFFFTSFICATRLGETLGLKFSDFDSNKNTLTIKRQRSVESGVTTPKTASSADTIRLPKYFFDELDKYQKLIEGQSDDFLFFPTRMLARTTIRRVMDSHIETAEIKHITIHGLRHSMASHLLANKFNYLFVSKYLRHSSPATTLRTYAHWIETTEHEQIDNI